MRDNEGYATMSAQHDTAPVLISGAAREAWADAMLEDTLYCGDNLDRRREYVPDESVDLICLDPRSNSNRSYNVLFKEANGTASIPLTQAQRVRGQGKLL